MQFFRRGIQILIWLLILAIPFLHLYGVERYARENFTYSLAAQRIESKGPQHRVIVLIDKVLGGSEKADSIISSVTGSPWSINILGYRVSDPLAAISLSIAGNRFYWPFLTSILFFVFLSLIFGRVFCGWICPYHFLAEMNDKIRGLFFRLGLKPHDLHLKRRNKYIILAVLFLSSLIAGTSLFTHIYPPLLVSREVFYYIFYSSVGFGTFFILFLLLTELTVSKRWWCRYFCPGGALYSILGSLRVLRMVRDDKRCTLCGECDRACPFGLLPMSDRMGMECDNCGLCRSACPEDALSYRFMPLWRERKTIRERGLYERTGTNG